MKPKSVGEIRLQSRDPLDYPVIDPRYFEDERDVTTMVAGDWSIYFLKDVTLMLFKRTMYANHVPCISLRSRIC